MLILYTLDAKGLTLKLYHSILTVELHVVKKWFFKVLKNRKLASFQIALIFYFKNPCLGILVESYCKFSCVSQWTHRNTIIVCVWSQYECANIINSTQHSQDIANPTHEKINDNLISYLKRMLIMFNI